MRHFDGATDSRHDVFGNLLPSWYEKQKITFNIIIIACLIALLLLPLLQFLIFIVFVSISIPQPKKVPDWTMRFFQMDFELVNFVWAAEWKSENFRDPINRRGRNVEKLIVCEVHSSLIHHSSSDWREWRVKKSYSDATMENKNQKIWMRGKTNNFWKIFGGFMRFSRRKIKKKIIKENRNDRLVKENIKN